METDSRGNIWIREALTPRMIVLFIILAFAAGLCIRLGYWQLERATSRGADRVIAQHEERLGEPAQPLHEVLGLQTTMTADEYARPVYVTGRFADQLRVVDRSVGGENADLILTQLVLTEGPDKGGNVPVVRGWVPAGEDLPPAPTGTQTVFGYLSGPEDSIGGLTETTALSISAAELVNAWGSPILSGYIVQFTVAAAPSAIANGSAIDISQRQEISDGVRHAPPPKPVEDGGFNLQNAAYAIEWVIFAGFALFIWFRILRGAVMRRREDELLEQWADEFAGANSSQDATR
ncbi:SURF1 family protein [Flaviflexus huanghaiensis]|uniref:SURF1 family protein n=1 Tax=Flaviflexus huanghaiensis TaxID=1111473 RepID=UPI0015FA4169|nr:SURF1 family protein [Flaviflexus huanghaiensis]